MSTELPVATSIELSDSVMRTGPSTLCPDIVRNQMERIAATTGIDVFAVDAEAGVVLGASCKETLAVLPAQLRTELCFSAKSPELFVHNLGSGLSFFAVPLDGCDRPTFACGYVFSSRTGEGMPLELALAATEAGWTREKLDSFVDCIPLCSAELLECALNQCVGSADRDATNEELRRDMESLTRELDQTYEEISLLHTLSRNLQISKGPLELAKVCLGRLHSLLPAAANVIWVEEKGKFPQFLIEGEMGLTQYQMAHLVARFEEHDWSRPLVRNNLNHSKYRDVRREFPEMRNFVIVPISQGQHRSGWIVSINLEEGREYGTVEASLMNSVATILGTHLRNIDLYRQHDELLLSFVRSMVSSLDAKDPYTRGHSERVALAARRIAEEIGLPEEEINSIYLSGLLHDIGKIGVDDRILTKPGKLTDEEFEQIKAHPVIGYEILKGLKNLQHVLPGVRHHHESWDGSGYPDGLRGEQIPMMARILAVADSYDAMGSDRPYRKGMPIEKIEGIFRDGADQQWDGRIIAAYFAARHDIVEISRDYRLDRGLLLDSGGLAISSKESLSDSFILGMASS